MSVLLVLLSACTHALWNALLRLEPDKDRGLVGAVATASLLATIVATIRWAAGGPVPFTSLDQLVWTVAAGICEWLYFRSLARALSSGSLGPVYTISRGGAMLVAYPISIALFGEKLDTQTALGSSVVLIGLVFSGSGSGSADRRGISGRALAWSVLCAVAIAAYHLAYKAALDAGAQTSAAFAVSLGLSTVLNASVQRGWTTYVRPRLGRVVLMGVICGSSFLLLLEALASDHPGFVLTLRNTSVLFATGMAFAIGERPHRLQILGALTVAGGAILMAAG